MKNQALCIEGRLRQNEYVDGQYYDTITMGLLREEFYQRAKE
ncbi:hypothetical protein [Brevibacillus fortis]